MRTVPVDFAEHVENVGWLIQKRLQVIEELARSPDVSEIVVPDIVEANERCRRALVVGDREAEYEAIVNTIRAGMMEWWPDFPERRLLTDLFRRSALRGAARDNVDSTRKPLYSEGLRVARALLAEVGDTGSLDLEYEYTVVSEFLASSWLSPNPGCSPCELQDYIERSGSSRAYYDALRIIVEKLFDRGVDVPRPLFLWLEDVVFGRRRRPDVKPLPPNRSVNPLNLPCDVQIEFTIEVLRKVGVLPRGTHLSGCRVVAEVLGLSEDHVERIWKERGSAKSYEPMLRKHLGAVSDRTGLVYTNEA